jgi:hypothetical protein
MMVAPFPQNLLWHGEPIDTTVVGSVGEGLFVTIGPWRSEATGPTRNLLRLWRVGAPVNRAGDDPVDGWPPVKLDEYQIPAEEFVMSWGENASGTIAIRTEGPYIPPIWPEYPSPDGLYVITSDGSSLMVDSVQTPGNADWPAVPDWPYARTLVSGDGQQVFVDFDERGTGAGVVWNVNDLSVSQQISIGGGWPLNRGYVAAFPRANRVLWVNTSPVSLAHRDDRTYSGKVITRGEFQLQQPPAQYPWSVADFVDFTFTFDLPAFDASHVIAKYVEAWAYFRPSQHTPTSTWNDALVDVTGHSSYSYLNDPDYPEYRGGYVLQPHLTDPSNWQAIPERMGYWGNTYMGVGGTESLDPSLSGDFVIKLRANGWTTPNVYYWDVTAAVFTEYDNSDAHGGHIELRDFTNAVISSVPYVEECFTDNSVASGYMDSESWVWEWPKVDYAAWISTGDGGAVYTRGIPTSVPYDPAFPWAFPFRDDMTQIRYRKVTTTDDTLAWVSDEAVLPIDWGEDVYGGERYDYGLWWVPVILGCWNGIVTLGPKYTDGGD